MSKIRNNAIEIRDLRKSFGNYTAVHRLNLEIAEGEFFSLIGPSGCGKTTTLRMIAGLAEQTAGQILVHGKDLSRVPAHKRPVNTVFQHYGLFPHLSVFDNIAFGLETRGISRADIRTKVHKMLDLVRLPGRDAVKPADLSGGQKQRVALARSLVMEPEVLLLDEPLGALDLKLRREMQELLRKLQREIGITFVYVTHDQEEAFSMSSRIGIMHEGHLIQVSTPRELYARPQSTFVARFCGSANMIEASVGDVRGAGTYTAMASGGFSLLGQGRPGLLKGAKVNAVIRPETIYVASGEAFEMQSEGRVIDSSYAGPHTTYLVETDRLGVIRASGRKEDDTGSPLQLGARVTIGWRASSVWLVDADETMPSSSFAQEDAQKLPQAV